jgi:adenine-specific DNA-methyltransferase
MRGKIEPEIRERMSTTAKPYGPGNPHPLSQIRTELVWEGKYDEYGNRRDADVVGVSMPMQKIETIDQPRSEAAAAGQLDMFEKKTKRLDDFRNMLIWGDNKLVAASLLKDFKGRIDLIYIDPPFDVGADFTMEVPIGEGREAVEKDQSTLEMVAYRDMWGKGTNSYLHMMFERLALMKELLSEYGSIYVHLGPNVSSHVELLLDEVFGSERVLTSIVWQRATAHGNAGVRYGNITDRILYATKSDHYKWNKGYQPYSKEYLESHYSSIEQETGRRFTLRDLTASMSRASESQVYEWKGVRPVGSRCGALPIGSGPRPDMERSEKQGA